ncbi:hypothetical protein [Hydrogenophaga sp. BPS33]|uniref:hypothetical protein n=1 Tax=Hydrogenophaga sp. BPS33 TaxID=2651974 RepID=UPI00131F9F37|nr:hypothetical protein [Hydrogenophaga sp. BPS33]QHE86931.1 hypothetical protein F9K07_19515 [Hydrogenophaga sp. BPS33]
MDSVAVRGAFLSQQIPGMDHTELDALNRHLDQLSADDLQDPAIAHLTVSVKATLLDRHVRSNPMLSDALDPNTTIKLSNLSAPDLAALVGLQQDAQNLSRPLNFSQIYLSQTDDEPTGLIPGTKDFSFERLNHIEATGKAAKEQLLDREYAGDSAAKQALQNMSVRDDE